MVTDKHFEDRKNAGKQNHHTKDASSLENTTALKTNVNLDGLTTHIKKETPTATVQHKDVTDISLFKEDLTEKMIKPSESQMSKSLQPTKRGDNLITKFLNNKHVDVIINDDSTQKQRLQTVHEECQKDQKFLLKVGQSLYFAFPEIMCRLQQNQN